MADAADLDAGTVVAQRFFQLSLDQPVVAPLVHVDEVDHDETGEVAQAKLPRDFLRRFEICLERGVLDIVLARGLAGVDVDRDQRFRLIDDDIAAGSTSPRDSPIRPTSTFVTRAQRSRALSASTERP